MKPSRKELETNFKRELIGNVAYQLFTRNSFDRVSMDDVARQAEFGKATLYKLFSGKEEILVYVICRGIDDHCRQMEEQCLNLAEPRQMLERLVELEYDFYINYSNLVLALLLRLSDDDLQADYLGQIRQQHHCRSRLVQEIIEEAGKLGLVLKNDSASIGRALESIMKGFMVNRIERQSGDGNRNADLELIKALLWQGLIS